MHVIKVKVDVILGEGLDTAGRSDLECLSCSDIHSTMHSVSSSLPLSHINSIMQ